MIAHNCRCGICGELFHLERELKGEKVGLGGRNRSIYRAGVQGAEEPYCCSFDNPVDAGYSHYEIQTVREYGYDDEESTYFDVVTELDECGDDVHNAIGPVLYGIYGRFGDGGAEHISDRLTLDDALDFLRKIGVETGDQ